MCFYVYTDGQQQSPRKFLFYKQNSCFNFIGLAIPAVVFLFVILTPSESSELTKPEENPAKNTFIPLMWFFFTGVLICYILICIPLFNLWVLTLIPQRVDSRAQKEFYEKQEKLKDLENLGKEKQKALDLKNEEAAQLLLHKENLPNNNLNMNSNINVRPDVQIQPPQPPQENNDRDNINNINNIDLNNQPNPVPVEENKQDININANINNPLNPEPSRSRLQKLKRTINRNNAENV